ncbi:MAG: MaoC/PaaZ C-terminal domain-containing protein [Acidimicrobiales bacterium]
MVAVGDEIPELVIDPVDTEKMKTMAALLQDPNPIHWDVEVVKKLGMGDKAVNQGPNNWAYIGSMLAAWAGGDDKVRNMKVRFLDNVFAGDRVVAGGKVTAVEGDLVTCDVWLARDGDHPVVAGTAVVQMT